MPLETIYVVRHGHRLNWTVNPSSGQYHSTTPTPTGNPADTQLASYGTDQAEQLATKIASLSPTPDILYSSPWYRCIQTLAPSVKALHARGKTDGLVRVENGFGEFFGTAHFSHPPPASASDLKKHFSFIDQTYKPSIRPSPHGETLQALHDRHAYALHRTIQALDSDPRQPRALLICTHAAAMICMGRTLTGRMPSDATEQDFRCGTCALSRFDRRKRSSESETKFGQGIGLWNDEEPEAIPQLDWKNGKGVGGGWDCSVNGDCSFLTGGEERTWHFAGDESFITGPQVDLSGSDLPLRIISSEIEDHTTNGRSSPKL